MEEAALHGSGLFSQKDNVFFGQTSPRHWVWGFPGEFPTVSLSEHCTVPSSTGNGKSFHLISYSIQGQKHQCSIPISFCKWRSGPSPVRPPTPQDPRKLLLPSQLARWELACVSGSQPISHLVMLTSEGSGVSTPPSPVQVFQMLWDRHKTQVDD